MCVSVCTPMEYTRNKCQHELESPYNAGEKDVAIEREPS